MGHPGLPDLGRAVDIPGKYTHNNPRRRQPTGSPQAAALVGVAAWLARRWGQMRRCEEEERENGQKRKLNRFL
jgi:hypothetical protein